MRRPTERDRSWSDRVLFLAACGVAAACVPFADIPSLGHPLVTFGAFIAVTELLDTELASGRRLQLSLAPGFAFAMLGGDAASGAGAATVALTFLIAAVFAQAVRAISGRDARPRDTAASFLAIAAAAAVYDALVAAGPMHLYGAQAGGGRVHLASGAGIAAVLAVALLFEPMRVAVSGALDRNPAAHGSFRRTLRTTAPLATAIVSVAALVALAFPKLGGWSFPLFLGPLAATRYAFRQITTIRTTEVQTLRALSKIPEMAGYTHPGHSRRVAELAISMARHLGMAEDDIREIEYAALLHDIGRVVLEDPEAGDEVALSPQVALTGADIVAAAGTFPRVARMIREQHEPYRRRGEVENRDIPAGARILKVANVFDDLARPGGVGLAPWDALERLHQGAAYDYDPTVVAALGAVLQRDGSI